MSLSVDDYVKTNILPEHQDIVKAIRDLMRECAPNAKEAIAYGSPVWKGKKIFAIIIPNKKNITLTFTHGAEFDDKYGMLKGVAKVARHVKIADVQDITLNEVALRYYVQQALEFDAK